MDEREQIEKPSLNKIMLQRTSEISSQNPRRKRGGAQKDKWKVKMDFIWGLKDQKNTFRDQEEGRPTKSVRGKSQE